jgi:PilX N-terminal
MNGARAESLVVGSHSIPTRHELPARHEARGTRHHRKQIARSDGVVLVATLLVLLLMSAVGAALVLVSSSETLIAANFRNSHEALYAAEAAAERAIADFAAVPDVDLVLSGAGQSTFVDGPPGGLREWQGVRVDLTEVVNLSRCRKKAPCTDAEMDSVTIERPWGPNNPRWQPYAYGWLKDAWPSIVSPFYVVVLIGDDPSENDNDPLRDGAAANVGAGVVALRAEAFGPRSVHKAVDLTIGRAGEGKVRVVSWHQSR